MSNIPENPSARVITRRRLIGNSVRVAAAALAASLMPPNVRRALAQPFRGGQLSDIKHVVLLMQENRSFDHYFGTMAGVRGFDDPNALPARLRLAFARDARTGRNCEVVWRRGNSAGVKFVR